VNKRRILDDELLAALAATGPEALQIVEQIKAQRRRGRPASAEADYRRLELWWRAFRRLNSELTADHALRKFLRQRRTEIERNLNLKRDTVQSLRNAIARGKKESERVRRSRRASWQIIPAGLADAVHGRRRVLIADPDEAILIRHAMEVALLGK
jgi:hypothetical protein